MSQTHAISKLSPHLVCSYVKIQLQEDAATLKAHKLICAPQLKIMADMCTVTFPPTDNACSQLPRRYGHQHYFNEACCVVRDLGESHAVVLFLSQQAAQMIND